MACHLVTHGESYNLLAVIEWVEIF